jgi:hypothetical protein
MAPNHQINPEACRLGLCLAAFAMGVTTVKMSRKFEHTCRMNMYGPYLCREDQLEEAPPTDTRIPNFQKLTMV